MTDPNPRPADRLSTPVRDVVVGRESLHPVDVLDLALGRARAQLHDDAGYRAKIQRGAEVVQAGVRSGASLYGITTGFGDSCETEVPAGQVAALPVNLMRYHGCGAGPFLSEIQSAAVVAVRLSSLSRGYSGVREVLLERLCDLLNFGVLPRIPSRGSVGASGDLTPLSYVVATLVGERDVSYRGRVMPAAAALTEAGLKPIDLAPKESLALMNGTSVMTGLGVLIHDRAKGLGRLASALTAMAVDVMRGNRFHYDPRIGDLKPHPGQRQAANWIREDLEYDARTDRPKGRLQDRYSLRCAPHVIGALLDGLEFTHRTLGVELNSVNDNPIVDPDAGEFVNGGNFFGGHVALVMDMLKPAIANVAGLMDRQLALLCSATTNAGLPDNLVAPRGDAASHHGFKAMQITASALCAEALKQTMPASVFSRSTECHNQDIVSMGTHAALDAQVVLELAEMVAAVHTLALCQAVDLRGREGCHRRSLAMHGAVRASVPMVDRDRRQDGDIERVVDMIRTGQLPLGEPA